MGNDQLVFHYYIYIYNIGNLVSNRIIYLASSPNEDFSEYINIMVDIPFKL